MSETNDVVVNQAILLYEKHFNALPDVIAIAPGRVNLIGEHTDYNDGFVLPFALPFKTVIVGSKANTTAAAATTVISSFNESEPSTFTISDKLSKGTPEWANYVKGTIYQYLNELNSSSYGDKPIAFNAIIASDVPVGSGLSSSAALEVATATFLEKLYKIDTVDKVQKSLRCQKAEHTFADTPCGIMDQYISANGEKDFLLLIDCRTQTFERVSFSNPSISNSPPVILIINSNVKHQLSGSEYPDRVRQCKEAVTVLQQKNSSVTALRDATMAMLDECKDDMSHINYMRAKHCITEDIRTNECVKALTLCDYVTVGRLMTESHMSLKNDYEVSCNELDILVTLALQVDGVYGSRMTGGGFGGCTVTLVDKAALPVLKELVATKYYEITGCQCELYEAAPSEGARGYYYDHTQFNKDSTPESQGKFKSSSIQEVETKEESKVSNVKDSDTDTKQTNGSSQVNNNHVGNGNGNDHVGNGNGNDHVSIWIPIITFSLAVAIGIFAIRRRR